MIFFTFGNMHPLQSIFYHKQNMNEQQLDWHIQDLVQKFKYKKLKQFAIILFSGNLNNCKLNSRWEINVLKDL